MNTECPFVTRALQGEPIVNIGQLSKETVRQLDKLVKTGALLKAKLHWDTLSPIFGLGRPKNCWFLPSKEPMWDGTNTKLAGQ